MKSSIKNLIDTLKGDSKELEGMILERIKTINHLSNDELHQALIEDPYSLELSLEDTELDMMHAYDLGRLEAFEEITNVLNEIINEKHKV